MPRKQKKSFTRRTFSKIKGVFTWYVDIPRRFKMLCMASASFILALFFSLSVLNKAGRVGSVVREYLFSGDGVVLFGYGLIIVILVLFSFSFIVFFKFSGISMIRFWSGSLILFASVSGLLTGSDETSAGVIGVRIFDILFKAVGEIFSYALLLGGVFVALYMLKLFSPLGVWKWVHNRKESDGSYGDGDEEYEGDGEDEEYESELGEDDDVYDGDDVDGDDVDALEEDGDVLETEEIESASSGHGRARNRKRSVGYKVPPLSLLNSQKGSGQSRNSREQAQSIVRTLQNFNIDVSIEDVVVGPTFTRYSVRPAEGVRLQKITALQQNLELALAAHPIRIEAPIPGESLVGIEIPNAVRATVGLKDLLKSKHFTSVRDGLPLVVGKTITGAVFVRKLTKMPHMLVAGTTGSGKSVTIHNFILSMLFSYGPKDMRFILIDPKRVELTLYKGIPHLYTDPITNPKKALKALVWVVNEMERRYQLLEDLRARDVASYNATAEKRSEETLPYLVVVIDELADLMQTFPREIEANIVRIAQKSRAVGIHIILSTQRPSVNVITGLVKANIPVRVALQVASNVDSRTILDSPGAENLVGNGDLLFVSAETQKPIRIQSAFVSEEEVKKVVSYIRSNNPLSDDLIDIEQTTGAEFGGGSGGSGGDSDDDLYEEAKDIVISAKKASTSLLQRKLKVGYSRAARLIDMLEQNGVVGPQVGSKPRDILESE